MVNYQDSKHGLCDVECLVICLNSLGKLEALDDDELKNYVVYIDEVSSLLAFYLKRSLGHCHEAGRHDPN